MKNGNISPLKENVASPLCFIRAEPESLQYGELSLIWLKFASVVL